jgi:hypothetical protein
MSNKTIEVPDPNECHSVEILTSETTGKVIGYCLGGGRPGPNLLVSGHPPLIDDIFEKLIQIPTLPWMWGKLYLVNLNALDGEAQGNPWRTLNQITFDDSVFLPPLDAASDVVGSTADACKTVLRACAGMGMIVGR